MEMTLERAAHSLAVAKKMRYAVVAENLPISPSDAFLIGFLHDIGYEFAPTQEEHARVGGEILRGIGFPYWKEVCYHGIPQDEYESRLLALLNLVDMTTAPTGEPISVEDRLREICKRYGKDSKQANDARELIKQFS